MGKMGMQPIPPTTVPVKKIKGLAHQCYGDGDGVVSCKQALIQKRLRRRLVWTQPFKLTDFSFQPSKSQKFLMFFNKFIIAQSNQLIEAISLT